MYFKKCTVQMVMMVYVMDSDDDDELDTGVRGLHDKSTEYHCIAM